MTKTRICPACNAPHLRCHTRRIRQFGTSYEFRCDACQHELSAPGLSKIGAGLLAVAVVSATLTRGLLVGSLSVGEEGFLVGLACGLIAAVMTGSMLRNRLRLTRQPVVA